MNRLISVAAVEKGIVEDDRCLCCNATSSTTASVKHRASCLYLAYITMADRCAEQTAKHAEVFQQARLLMEALRGK